MKSAGKGMKWSSGFNLKLGSNSTRRNRPQASKGPNPRFVVTNLTSWEYEPSQLYEKFCARSKKGRPAVTEVQLGSSSSFGLSSDSEIVPCGAPLGGRGTVAPENPPLGGSEPPPPFLSTLGGSSGRIR